MSLRKLSRGAKIRGISVGTWNRMVEVTRRVEGETLSQTVDREGLLRSQSLIKVKNGSGARRLPFEILGLGSPIVPPGTNLVNFKDQVAQEGATPTTASHRRKWVVTLDNIPINGFGLAVVAGVMIAQVDITSTIHPRATVKNNDAAKLESSFWGCAEILWAEAGTGVKWAILRIGDHGGGLVRGKSSGTIALNATGTVTVWTGANEGSASTTTITGVYNPYAEVGNLVRVGVMWCDTAEQPELVAAGCE